MSEHFCPQELYESLERAYRQEDSMVTGISGISHFTGGNTAQPPVYGIPPRPVDNLVAELRAIRNHAGTIRAGLESRWRVGGMDACEDAEHAAHLTYALLDDLITALEADVS